MKKIGVVINTKRPRTDGVLAELRLLAEQHGMTLYAENEKMAPVIGASYLPIEEFAGKVDLVLAMGGDGTVLYTAKALHGLAIPIMGVNLGSLGFLTSVADSELQKAFASIVDGTYKESGRDVLEYTVWKNGASVGGGHALNDVVVGWGSSSRIVTLKLTVDTEEVGVFMCDGMIISTPTGSTGHALSSGGPILHPELCGFGINVICPHTLSTRPLVVPKYSSIEVEVLNSNKDLLLSVDGQDEFSVQEGDCIKLKQSDHKALFIQQEDHSYFSVLAQKLHWRGSSL